ncbi:hypothetical protein BH23GEM4_BH23GEM4_01550 [soil metagenome]
MEMALFNRDYDRDFGRNRSGWGSTAGRGYDRGMRGKAQYAWREAQDETREGWNAAKRRFGGDGYDRDYAGRQGGGYGYGGGYGSGMSGYDREYGSMGGSGYDREGGRYGKSRWQTDQGDPFGDRDRNTPIRTTRGEFEAYDRDYGARGYRQGGYDRGYGGYAANRGDSGADRGYGDYDRGRAWSGNRGRGYDRGWF